MSQALEGRVALVTGANGGLGRHVVQALLDAGALVIGTSLKIAQTDFPSSNFTAMPADLGSREAAAMLVKQIVSRDGRFDILVHTVGGFAGGEPVASTTPASFESMFRLNFYSLLYMAQAAVPALRKSGHGRLIAIGSRAAVDPGAGVGAYSASKAAAVSLVRTLAAENKDAGVTANAILPGTIDTAANRQAMPNADRSKWVLPQNIASLIVWLASDAGREVNGASLPIFGADEP